MPYIRPIEHFSPAQNLSKEIPSLDFCFLLRLLEIYLFIWKAALQTARGKDRDIPPYGSLYKWLKWSALG